VKRYQGSKTCNVIFIIYFMRKTPIKNREKTLFGNRKTSEKTETKK
jgi:hypothetical protein